MATAIEQSIFDRLSASAELEALVGKNIFAEWRDDSIPAIVYEVEVQAVDQMYEGAGIEYLNLTVSAVAATLEKALVIAEAVILYLKDSDWEDTNNVVDGCFYLGRDKELLKAETKNKQLGIVDCRFEVLIRSVVA